MSAPAGPPQRVRVTSSRRWAVAPSARPIALELDEQTQLGGVYLGGLMRAQLRLSLLVLGTGAVILGGLPALMLLVPSTRTLSLWGLPFPVARPGRPRLPDAGAPRPVVRPRGRAHRAGVQ